MAENKTLCIACKYKFHDRDLQPCADCLRATQLVQRGVDRYQKAAEPKTGAPVPETRRAHPSAKTLCFAESVWFFADFRIVLRYFLICVRFIYI